MFFRDLALLRSLRFGCVCVRAPFGCVDFMHPQGAYVHVHVCALSGTHMCAQGACMFFFSQRALRFAPRLILTLRAWPSACSKNKNARFFENLTKFSLPNSKIRENLAKSTFGQALTHATLARAQHDVHVCKHACASMHTATRRVRVWTKPKDLTWNCCFRRVSPAFFFEILRKTAKKSWERSQNFRLSIKMAGFCQNYRKICCKFSNSGISLEKNMKMSSKFTQIDDF